MAQINLLIHADLSAPLLFVIDAQFTMYVVQQSRLGRTVAKPKDIFLSTRSKYIIISIVQRSRLFFYFRQVQAGPPAQN